MDQKKEFDKLAKDKMPAERAAKAKQELERIAMAILRNTSERRDLVNKQALAVTELELASEAIDKASMATRKAAIADEADLAKGKTT